MILRRVALPAGRRAVNNLQWVIVYISLCADHRARARSADDPGALRVVQSSRSSSSRWRSRRQPSESSGCSSTAPIPHRHSERCHPRASAATPCPGSARRARSTTRSSSPTSGRRPGFAMVVLSAALKGIPHGDHRGRARRRGRRVEHLPPHHAADAEPADLDRDGLALHQRDQGVRHHLRDDVRRRPGHVKPGHRLHDVHARPSTAPRRRAQQPP